MAEVTYSELGELTFLPVPEFVQLILEMSGGPEAVPTMGPVALRISICELCATLVPVTSQHRHTQFHHTWNR